MHKTHICYPVELTKVVGELWFELMLTPTLKLEVHSQTRRDSYHSYSSLEVYAGPECATAKTIVYVLYVTQAW